MDLTGDQWIDDSIYETVHRMLMSDVLNELNWNITFYCSRNRVPHLYLMPAYCHNNIVRNPDNQRHKNGIIINYKRFTFEEGYSELKLSYGTPEYDETIRTLNYVLNFMKGMLRKRRPLMNALLNSEIREGIGMREERTIKNRNKKRIIIKKCVFHKSIICGRKWKI